MSNACFISTAYWGPIQYYTKILQFGKVFIEQWETYPKQTYRNRTIIYGANGMQSLQVPVTKGSSKNILLKNIAISYDDNWQKNHFKSIESAYRSSPFYEYYIDDIIPIYEKKFKYLLDLNMKILETSMEMLELQTQITFTGDFVLDTEYPDFRNSMHPKGDKNLLDPNFKPFEYIQGFEQRHGFIPNLSILDLIFNAGPEASSMLSQSLINQ